MPRMRNMIVPAMIGATSLWTAPLDASSTTIHLTGYVPVYCNVDLVPALGVPAEDGVIALGTSRELCNAPHGYRIILEHPADMVDAAVISDATRIPLSPSGETVIWNSDQPGLETRQLALDLGQKSGTIKSVGLRIEVKY